MNTQISNDFYQHGGSYLISNNNYEDYIQGRDFIGRYDGQFMIPTNQMDDLLSNHPDNPREWERQIGLKEGSLADENIHRVDVYNPQDYEPRLPSKDLRGANDKFIEGGKTSGGQDECVINQFPNPEQNQDVGRITNLNPSLENSQISSSNTNVCAGELPPQQDLKTETSPEKSGVLPKEETSNNFIDSQKSGTTPDKKEAFDALNNTGKADAVVDTGKDIGNSATTGVATGIV